MKRGKPPYIATKASGYYWEPRGSIRDVSAPEALGRDRDAAYGRGWRLYDDARAALKEPSSKPRMFTVSWGVAQWRQSDSYSHRVDGNPKAPRTLESQEAALKTIERELGHGDLRGLKRRHLRSWYKTLKESGHLSMAALTMKTLRQLYTFFRDEGWYEGEHPATKIGLHVPRRVYTPWTFERVQLFVDIAVKMDRRSAGLAVALIYDTGQNNVDVLEARWPQYNGHEMDMARSKTGVGAVVPIMDWTKNLLDETPRQGVQIIIREDNQQPYKRRHFASVVRRVCKAAGLPDDLKAGNLRHEALQEAEDGGADPGAIQSLAAHSSVGTQEYYVKKTRADDAQRARARLRKSER